LMKIVSLPRATLASSRQIFPLPITRRQPIWPTSPIPRRAIKTTPPSPTRNPNPSRRRRRNSHLLLPQSAPTLLSLSLDPARRRIWCGLLPTLPLLSPLRVLPLGLAERSGGRVRCGGTDRGGASLSA
jgi:hypothetical protein